MISRESHWRSLAKSISYRFVGSSAAAVIVFLFTNQAGMAIAFGGADAVVKIVLFFLHERAWDKIKLGRHQMEPFVVWFTGLSGSGKTSLSKLVAEELKKKGVKLQHLDGDRIRSLVPQSGYARPERTEHLKRVALLVSYLENSGVAVVASFVSPYEESRQYLRSTCKNFIEIHVSTPLEECERRDTKGLYAKARRGELKNFTGIDDPYEPPLKPDLIVDTTKAPIEESVSRIMEKIRPFLG